VAVGRSRALEGWGGGEGSVFFPTERAAVQKRVAAWVWRLERERRLCGGHFKFLLQPGAGVTRQFNF